MNRPTKEVFVAAVREYRPQWTEREVEQLYAVCPEGTVENADDLYDLVQLGIRIHELTRAVNEERLSVQEAYTTLSSMPHCRMEPIGCAGPALVFRDSLSRREYEMSGLCQRCQDVIFKEE